MSQNIIIPYIVNLNKLIVLTIDNYNDIKSTDHWNKNEEFQIKINALRQKLIKGFPWYCGSTIEKEEKKAANTLLEFETQNPLKLQQYLLVSAIDHSKTICEGLVANYNYQEIFTEIKNTFEVQLKFSKQALKTTESITIKRTKELCAY